jgi:hypothetical protein
MQTSQFQQQPNIRASITYSRRRRQQFAIQLIGVTLAVLFFIGLYALANHEYYNQLEECQKTGFTAAQCEVIVRN